MSQRDESPAPVVAEVRRAPEGEPKVLTLVERLHGQAASLQAKWEQKDGTFREVQIAALLDLAAVEIARLTAERDEWKEATRKAIQVGGQLEAQVLEQRTIGHGEGQEHAIADVNAGRVDDLIRPRLDRAEADLESLRTRLRGLEQQWRKLARQRQEVAGGAQTDLSRYTNLASSQAGTACANELARLLTTPEEPGT